MYTRTKFILSFDCEGKWGGAQTINKRYNGINNKNLLDAYGKILKSLDYYDFPASFAFVASLILPKEVTLDTLLSPQEKGGDMLYGNSSWIERPVNDLKKGRLDGWLCPELLDMVLNFKMEHHVCSHGGCHIPYSEALTRSTSIEKDIKLIRYFFEMPSRIDKNIFIYPRNIIGFKEQLNSIGITSYRDIDTEEKKQGVRGKAVRYFNEILNFDCFPDKKLNSSEGMYRLTPGKFINPHISARALISRKFTINRVKAMINKSLKYNKNVHFYTHPHNFISDLGFHVFFDDFLHVICEYRDSGDIDIITMEGESNCV